MKTTKQQRIEELEAINKTLEERVEYYSDIVERTVRVLRSLYDYEPYRERTQINNSDVPAAVQKLKDQVRQEGKQASDRLDAIYQENNKLWYLIRSITGDKTLKGEPDGEVANHVETDRLANTPFIKPRF